MRKLFLYPVLGIVLLIFFAGNFRSTTTSKTAQVINTGYTSLNHFNGINTGTVTAYYKIYDKLTAPTYTTTPVMTIMCEAGREVWWNDIAFRSTPYVYTFTYGCWIRTVSNPQDSSNTTPQGLQIFEATYY